MDNTKYSEIPNLKIGLYKTYLGESTFRSKRNEFNESEIVSFRNKESKTEKKCEKDETPVSNTIISNSGWFQLYTTSKPAYGKKEYEENEYSGSEDELADKIHDSILVCLEETLNEGSIEFEISYLEANALINQPSFEIVRGEKDQDSENKSKIGLCFDLNKISPETFLRHEKVFGIPLVNVVICNFDNSPPISSISPEKRKYDEIIKLFEISCEYGEVDLVLVGISVSRSQEVERQSKKNFEKFKNELYRLFGYHAKDKCVWFSGSNQQSEFGDVLFTHQTKQVVSKVTEQLGPAVNSRIKRVVDFALTLRNDGPRPFHSSKIRLSSERTSIEDKNEAPNSQQDAGDLEKRDPNQSLTMCSSGLQSPVGSCRNTKCRKLQKSDIWYQWILDIINIVDLLALVLYKIGLVNEALLIYEQILGDFRVPYDNFVLELKNQSFGFAELMELKDPLILASDCCTGDCGTHSIENSSLVQREMRVLPLSLSLLKLSLNSTYFDIMQLVFSRKLLILASIGDFQKIISRFDVFVKRFLREIVSKIDDFEFKIASHFWIFRIAIAIASLQKSHSDLNGVTRENTCNLLDPNVLYNCSSAPSPIYNLKVAFISSLLPKLTQFLGESESFGVLKHKPSAPKLPPDSNVTPMEVQIALLKWATQCISSMLLNNFCESNDFTKSSTETGEDVILGVLQSRVSVQQKGSVSSQDHSGCCNSSCIILSSMSNVSQSLPKNDRDSISLPQYGHHSVLCIAAKHLSLATQIISKNIWNNQELSAIQRQSLIDSFSVSSSRNSFDCGEDKSGCYNLRELIGSLFSPFKAYRMLCEITGLMGMDYVSLGLVKSAVSSVWGVLFENKEFVDWIVKMVNDQNYLSLAAFEKKNSVLSDISFCYRFSRIWLDFTTVLLPVPFQWTNLNKITQKMLFRFLIRESNPISDNYALFNDPYILQAEIGIRLFLNQIVKTKSTNLACERNKKFIFDETEFKMGSILNYVNTTSAASNKYCLEECEETDGREFEVFESYIGKCLENSNILDGESAGGDYLQWEFPAHPNIWAYIFVSDTHNSNFRGNGDETKVPTFRFNANISHNHIDSVPYCLSENQDAAMTSRETQTQGKTGKGATLKIVERQILMALLGGGRLIRLPNRALPCCGLLDPLKPIQGYFYVFHEILRPSGRLFLKSPCVLSPLQTPLGSSVPKQRNTYREEQGTEEDRDEASFGGTAKEANFGIRPGETQKIEQEEARDEVIILSTKRDDSASGELNLASKYKTTVNGNNRSGDTGEKSNYYISHGSGDTYGGWFQKRSSKHERSYSLTNSELEHPGFRKKDGSPRQWMWEIVSGFKWGGNSYGSGSKNKNKTNSLTNEGLLGRNKVTEETSERELLDKCFKKRSKEWGLKTKKQTSALSLALKMEETSSPSKVITVPTPGPSNWVVTEAGRSHLQRRSRAPSPNSEPETTQGGPDCSSPVTPSNTWVDKSNVPGVPIKCFVLIYNGLVSPVRFSSVWLRINNNSWIQLENTIKDSQEKIGDDLVSFVPGINRMEIDIFYNEPLANSKFTINSIGFSIMKTGYSKLPINFLWVIPLGNLPSPHILPEVATEFNKYEKSMKDSHEFLSSSRLSNMVVDEYNKDNLWNPLRKWTTLYTFETKSLSEMICIGIKPLKNKASVGNLVLENIRSLENLIDESQIITDTGILATHSGVKSCYIFTVTVDNSWTQVNYVDLRVYFEVLSQDNDCIMVYLDEADLLFVDGRQIDKDNSGLNKRRGLHVLDLPMFSRELIFKVPIMFSFSSIDSATMTSLNINLGSELSNYNISSNSKFKFEFLVEPQTRIKNVQKVQNTYQMNIPFHYFEVQVGSSLDDVEVNKLIFVYPRETQELDSFGVLTAVPAKVSRDIIRTFILKESFAVEYRLTRPILIGNNHKPLKFVWIVPRNQLENNPKSQLYVSSMTGDSEEHHGSESISGPFEISIEKYKAIFALKDSAMYANLNCIQLEKVDHPPQSKVDTEFDVLVSMRYISGTEEVFHYSCEVEEGHDRSSDKRGSWWFIGSRNGTIEAKPNSEIKIKFRVVPLRNGIIDLPSIHIGRAVSARNKKIFLLGKQIVL